MKRIRLGVNRHGAMHLSVQVFCDGASCGTLVMRNDEADALVKILEMGVKRVVPIVALEVNGMEAP